MTALITGISLPRSILLLDMSKPNPSSPIRTLPQSSADEPSPSGASILIVDDNLQNLELLQAYLEDMDAELRLAHDGSEALAAVEAKQPDIILLDVMMPKVSGFQACAKLKASPDTRDIPIIMITALNEISDVERAVESGADDFLTKPVNKLELVTRVRSLLRVRLLKRQLDRTMDQLKRLKGG
jgi:two-component system, OmpR family, alkaline phosphatase synthesis response regulator PhoP